MPAHSLRTPLRVFAAALVFVHFAEAQTSRPGGAARSNASTTRSTTTRSGTTQGGAARSSTGQRQYRSNTELGDAVISIDPETRSLVIVTDEDTHREMVSVIKTLDKPKPQVLIKVVFLEVTYNKGLDLGLEGSYTANLRNPLPASTGTRVTNTVDTRNTDAGGTRTTTTNLTNILGDAANLGQSGTISSLFGAPLTGGFVRLVSDDWTATLHALARKGKVEVLSRPSIMARNNQEAVIVVGQEVPFITNSRTTDQGQTLNTIQYDNVGIILRVTPFITSEGTVEMIVAPEISNINNSITVPIGNNINAITIDKRSAETVVVTPHAQTVVIGGLMSTSRDETVQKIPILGDIPILGIPFRRTIKNDVKTELLIFLTPYIVNDAHGIAQATSDELSKSELSEKAFTERDFAKYLDDLPLPSDGARKRAAAATPMPVKKATGVPKAKKP